MTKIADHDAYIAAAPEAFRPSLERLRALLARALPEAEEIVGWHGRRCDTPGPDAPPLCNRANIEPELASASALAQ